MPISTTVPKAIPMTMLTAKSMAIPTAKKAPPTTTSTITIIPATAIPTALSMTLPGDSTGAKIADDTDGKIGNTDDDTSNDNTNDGGYHTDGNAVNDKYQELYRRQQPTATTQKYTDKSTTIPTEKSTTILSAIPTKVQTAIPTTVPKSPPALARSLSLFLLATTRSVERPILKKRSTTRTTKNTPNKKKKKNVTPATSGELHNERC